MCTFCVITLLSLEFLDLPFLQLHILFQSDAVSAINFYNSGIITVSTLRRREQNRKVCVCNTMSCSGSDKCEQCCNCLLIYAGLAISGQKIV